MHTKQNAYQTKCTPPSHLTTTREFIWAYFIQIVPQGDPAFPRMIQMSF